jgi:hypothetical protein
VVPVFGRRLSILLVVLGLLAIPAGALRAACVGRSCTAEPGTVRVPFCPLPATLKADIAAGYREGRSPDVLAVAVVPAVRGGTDDAIADAPWPSVSRVPDASVPIVFAGAGVDPGATIPRGTGLDRIAPTLSEIVGLRRPHPEVRSGVAVPGVVAPGVAAGDRPRLVLEIAWKGVGTADLRSGRHDWPFLASLLRSGTGTLDGATGSLPLDPAATLTTIGTGGLPSQHGITGTLVRNDSGEVVTAWEPGSPLSVIATMPDDLDQQTDQASKIGLVAPDLSDRGIIGGTWYLGHDRDTVAVASGPSAVTAASRLLATGLGRDGVPDVLAVVLDGSIRSMDRRTERIAAAARAAAEGSVVVALAGTGSAAAGSDTAVAASHVTAAIEAAVPGTARVVAGAVPGGLFLNQDTLASLGITGQVVVQALLQAEAPDGSKLFVDAFQGFAVSFARYC